MGIFDERLALSQRGFITWWMLTFRRNYVIEMVKSPLLKGIVGFSASSWLGRIKTIIEVLKISRRFPIPTKAFTNVPNTHRLLELEEKFFEHEDNKGRNALFRAIWRIFIVVYEHDGYYRSRIDWIIGELTKMVNQGSWKQGDRPKRFWKEFTK